MPNINDISTRTAFTMIMDTLCANVENNDETIDGSLYVKLDKSKVKVIVSSDIRLDNLNTDIFDIEIGNKTTTICYTKSI